MSSPADIGRAKQIKESEQLAAAWEAWNETKELLRETSELLNDPDPSMRSLAEEDHIALSTKLVQQIETQFPALLVPPSTTAHLAAMFELKSGVGGSEASLFLGDMLRMYQRYASSMGWKAQVTSINQTDEGGVKDAIMEVKGEGAYDSMRWESGVHRVQRVPATEASGRTHTSTVSVVVLPLAEGSDSGNEDLFSMDDIKLEVMRARGAGGQHVNKTESAVRLTHIPTGITVSMQDERSQHQNKRKAFQVLTARLMDRKLTKDIEERRATRRNLVRTADRSEKVRTYNYAQDRVTDHRIGLSLMNLASVMEGDGLHTFIDALKRDHEEGVMEALLEES
ncbi:hypothetical protein JAAARDRAFT_138047 [Jaapia argillacea MUCL 33604]|uniref:Prokaryotic-type class I peptide chain release factors domain-containing protein n=1 Tax=Jaapia argillacea MUCL 33604 TaxID=933084 RepID=A0A067PDX2_9AGAM|nr:hypothetical protein JAAARDRAFT_138047 [Jaapia argillacea MUCL 33604]